MKHCGFCGCAVLNKFRCVCGHEIKKYGIKEEANESKK